MKVTTRDVGAGIAADPGEKISDCDPEIVRGLLRTQGWIYFTGYSPTVDEFRDFTGSFGRCATPRSIPVVPGGAALGFHAEDSYNPWRPDALWFLCLSAGSDGGAPTRVVDGVQLLDALDKEWRDFSLANSLRFRRSWTRRQWEKLVPDGDSTDLSAFLDTLPGLSYQFLQDGTLETLFDSPMVVTTQDGRMSLSNTGKQGLTDPEFYGMSLSTGDPVPLEYLDHVEKMAIERELLLGWSEGNMLVIDNYRLMHRRAEYHGTKRELRVVHGEEFFGTRMPVATTPAAQALKVVLQGEEELR